MAQKRPFDGEEVNEVSSKYQRQDGHGSEITLHNNGFCRKADIVKLHDSGETSTRKFQVEYNDEFESVIYPGILLEGVQETQRDMPRSASLSPCPISTSSDEEDVLSEEMFHLPYYSECYNFDCPDRPVFDSNDVYRCMLDDPPQKHVLIGPEHQAEIPPWGENTSVVNPVEVYPDGTCILSVLETQYLVHGDLKAGGGRIDCQCRDQGSIRCVRFHIAESREQLSRILGQDTFMELGFENMGEVVADKWTNVEEQLFHDVVRSNPVSLGRNFWVALSAVFPSRTNMEIVSYYFNVFMLRKRAEQNRCDPVNVDSDDDEWHGNDNDMGQNIGGSDEDDDSGIESPVRCDGLTFHQNGLSVHQHEEDDSDVSDDAEETDVTSGRGRGNKSVADALQFTEKKSDGGENDTQDGSCTTSDSGASVQGAQTENVDCHDWHEYDAKSWDGYINCTKNNVDFLPTCSMIEEIFGGEFDFNDKKW